MNTKQHTDNEIGTAITKRFKLVCRNCGSEDCHLRIEEGTAYGGATGYCPGTITAGCNKCQKSDYWEQI